MFYNLHRDAIIGYKKLSDADLGTNPNGHQTHIGLYGDTLDFITNYYREDSAQLIYENSVYETLSMLDGIQNPDGTFRSPKIRIGEMNNNAVARKIRSLTHTNIQSNWYLIWFGLENEELVFILVQESSQDYIELTNLIGNLDSGRIFQNHPNLNNIILFLNSKVNSLNFSYFEELELLSQALERTFTTRRNPRRYDVIKAQQIFQEIGRKGEELVNNYLDKQVLNKEIRGFEWVNKNSESGNPFDFEITDNSNKLIYSDAKSTSYKFEQPIFFSSQELKFINQNPNYYIHRVFDMSKNPKLKVCNNIHDISHNFINNLDNFTHEVSKDELKVNSVKVSLKPTHHRLNFSEVII